MTDPIEDYFLSPSPAARRRSERHFAEIMGVELPEPEVHLPRFQVGLGCKGCKFLGGMKHEGVECDLFFCTKWETVLFLSGPSTEFGKPFGNYKRFDGNNYLDDPKVREVAIECLRRAIEKGLYDKTRVLCNSMKPLPLDYLGPVEYAALPSKGDEHE